MKKNTYLEEVQGDGVMVVVMEVDDEEESGGWRFCCWCWWEEVVAGDRGLSPESWWPEAPEEVVEVKEVLEVRVWLLVKRK